MMRATWDDDVEPSKRVEHVLTRQASGHTTMIINYYRPWWMPKWIYRKVVIDRTEVNISSYRNLEVPWPPPSDLQDKLHLIKES